MAIDSSRTVTDKTLLARVHIDRMPAVPVVEGQFVRVEPTGQTNPLGEPIYREHPESWRYTLRVSDPALLIDRQRFGLALIVREAAIMDGAPKTEAEVAATVNGLLARGVTLDDAITIPWEDLEIRRRAGQVLAVQMDVTHGRQRMADAGIPTT